VDNLPPAPLLRLHLAELQFCLRRRHHRRFARKAIPIHRPFANRPSLSLHKEPIPSPLQLSNRIKHPHRYLDRRQRRWERVVQRQLANSLPKNHRSILLPSARTLCLGSSELFILNCAPYSEDASGNGAAELYAISRRRCCWGL